MLEGKLQTLMHPPVSPERKRWKANERRWGQRHRSRDEREAAGRATLVARLKRNPDSVSEPPGVEPEQMSWDQVYLLQSIEGDGLRLSRGAAGKWQTLIPEFGEQVARAFRDGAVRKWRLYRPTLHSEGGGSSTIPYALVFAMVGLEIEAGEDGQGLLRLPAAEAAHALRYAFSELNGFSGWFEPLYKAHPQTGFELVWRETRWELENSGPEPMHYMLHDLVYHAPWLHAAVAPQIHDWLNQHGAANSDCLRYGRMIMMSGGVPRDQLAALGRTRAFDAATPDDQRPTWFAMWADNAPVEAIAALDEYLARLSRPEEARFAEQFVVALMGGRRQAGTITAAWKTPEHLKALYVLMYRHIRKSEDIDRANGGVYSPTTRDDAQDARNSLFNLLSAIPGEATYREILALAFDHPEPNYRAYMRRHAFDRAVADSDRQWSLAQVLALGIGQHLQVG